MERTMNRPGADRTRQIVTVGAGTLLTIVMGVVLLVGSRYASRLTSNVGALQTASSLTGYPALLNEQLSALRDRLEARAYAGQALSDLRTATETFDRDLKNLVVANAGRSPELVDAGLLWRQFAPVLDPVISFAGQPYVDSDASGSAFSREGRQHYADVKRAQLFVRENSGRLHTQLDALASRLQGEASAQAGRLRLLLSGGVLVALVLAIAAAYLHITRSRHERTAREAQEQTRDILKTVKEGFFLLDADYRIGSVWSDALARQFGKKDFAGLPFEELLEGLVQASTLATATKYIKLLWGERAHENLMKSINPLGQLEVHVDNGHGGHDTRYLQFDFHRVMGPKGVKHVLVSVSDITSSVLLARELQESQENANAQVEMMMGVMHIDPLQLGSFLDATETGLQLINAILKEPARTDGEFRKKLDGMFRELHSIKGEASAIELMTVAHRVHTLEDAVSELKKKPGLSGNDFLPLVVKLDELMAHLKMVRELAARFSSLREPEQALTHTPSQSRGPSFAEEMLQTLNALASRLAHDHQKKFRLEMSGLAEVPTRYRGVMKDVLIQMLRNSAVHGIEPINLRRVHAKEETGTVRVEFKKRDDGYELSFEDDGNGIAPEQLKAAALRKHLITPEEAESMDSRAAMGLIFRAGFSTQEQISMDAGRGVGMDVVARSVSLLGGKIGVTTNPGKFTRFKIALPISEEADSAVA
jgi:two-component system, chemotaxis family, sensor kinase CheA